MTIRFQGRKVSRRTGVERRERILNATLAIIAREGVRGVRHRAVAAEADVPLSATTYYFKDLTDLLGDAFRHYARSAMAANREFEKRSYDALRQFEGRERTDEVIAGLVDTLTELTTSHIEYQVTEARDYRLVESAFSDEALRDPGLKKVLVNKFQVVVDLIEAFLALAGSPNAALDSKLLLAIILRTEYECVLQGDEAQFDRAAVEQVIRRQVELILRS